MKRILANNEGYAMVVALSFITGLALLATIIVAVATSEKKTSFNDFTYSRSFYSADAGGEAAINWLRLQTSPPIKDNVNNVFVPTGFDTLTADHKYKHNVAYTRKRPRAGWDFKQYKDFEYKVEADGSSVQQSEAEVELQVLRLFREGY